MGVEEGGGEEREGKETDGCPLTNTPLRSGLTTRIWSTSELLRS
jgi:hypothetical protein